jgi:GNAT superfamily N-acetyltransferase
MPARRATAADLEIVTTIVTRAFATDPIWSVALARADGSTAHQSDHWRRYVRDAIGQRWVWLSDGMEATSVWIPPGGHELSERSAASLGPWLEEALGAGGRDAYLELSARFEAAHPPEPAHYYLTLLATSPEHRGRGVGMALLAENLATIDAQSRAAYLESTNPANDHRYERVGFRPIGRFEAPSGDAAVTTMWRDPR